MASEFLNIPGNIKQMYLPFVLNKSNPIFKTPIQYVGAQSGSNTDTKLVVDASGYTQYFSFKPNHVPETNIDAKSIKDVGIGGLLRIAPHSYYSTQFLNAKDDISYRLLYESSSVDQGFEKLQQLTPQIMLDDMPDIDIREYLQDAKLNMVFDLFQSFGNGMSDGLTSGENDRNNGEYSPFKNLNEFGMKVWNFIKAITTNFGEIMTASTNGLNIGVDFMINNPANDAYVLKFPYMLYYRLMSTTTTNIYNIPYNGQVLYESQGGGFSKGGLGGLTTDGKSIFGQFVNWFGKNIRINTTPTWDGPQDVPTKVDIDFSLYNDSLDGALKNFIFVNTIVPNNKWLQYHVFQHAPCLYDVKINGINRLFMCQGDFKVEGKGVLRRPSPEFINVLFGMFTNENIKENFTDSFIQDNELIRIPDIYDVHMTFTSLLPNNFNNFLFANYANETIKTKITGNNLHTESFLNPMANELGNIIDRVWKETKKPRESRPVPIIYKNNELLINGKTYQQWNKLDEAAKKLNERIANIAEVDI